MNMLSGPKHTMSFLLRTKALTVFYWFVFSDNLRVCEENAEKSLFFLFDITLQQNQGIRNSQSIAKTHLITAPLFFCKTC